MSRPLKQNYELALVERALMNRHRKDLFYLQVTLGAGYGNSPRADAVALKPSWSKPCVTIYEIKTSVSDLRGDEKWVKYLDYCNRFYFACPTGLVSPEEIPDPAGLVVVGPKGARAVKKPIMRNTDNGFDPLLYGILLHKFGDDKVSDRGLESLKRWLRNKKMYEDMGRQVGLELKRRLDELDNRARELEGKEIALQETVDSQKRLKEVLEPLGYPYRFLWDQKLGELVALKVVLDKVKTFADAAPAIREALDTLVELAAEVESARAEDAD